MRYRNDISAGVIVFHRDGDECRFLLLLSRLTKRPLWEFPKGGVDEGETLVDAALRELAEETGLAGEYVRVLPPFERREDYRFSTGSGDDRTLVRKRVTYFLAEATHMDVRLSEAEASDFAWLPLDAALRRIRYKARRAILQDAAVAANCDSGRNGRTADAVAALQSETSSRRREVSRRSDMASA